MSSADPRVAALLDREEIKEVIYRWCRGVDRLDWDLVRSCYHDGAVEDHGVFNGSAEEFIAFGREFIVRWPHTMHAVMNVLVDFEADDAAVAESYGVGFHRGPDDSGAEADVVVGFRYVDRFERRGGAWKIAHRRMVFEWTRQDPVGESWPMGDEYLMGRRDRADALYEAGGR